MSLGKPAPEFTGALLRELLRSKRIVRGSYKLPSRGDCDLLASALNALTRRVSKPYKRMPIQNLPADDVVGRRKVKLKIRTSVTSDLRNRLAEKEMREDEEETSARNNLEEAWRRYASGEGSSLSNFPWCLGWTVPVGRSSEAGR